MVDQMVESEVQCCISEHCSENLIISEISK